jgi:hypothetical protein
MFFISHKDLPSQKKATYLRIVAKIREEKKETHRLRFTVGGNLIQYDGNVSSPTADLTTAKLIFNSVLSTPDAKFMTIDIKDFYLKAKYCTPKTKPSSPTNAASIPGKFGTLGIQYLFFLS